MKHIKPYRIFESSVRELRQIATDSLSDLIDDGFNVIVSEQGSVLMIDITKPGMEYNRHTKLGFYLKDIMNNIQELLGRIDSKPKDVYYHVKGYEPSTWYSLSSDFGDPDNNAFKGDSENLIDQLTFEFNFQ